MAIHVGRGHVTVSGWDEGLNSDFVCSVFVIYQNGLYVQSPHLLLLAEAYDALDPNGNITIKWDIINWTPDGYVVSTNILLF